MPNRFVDGVEKTHGFYYGTIFEKKQEKFHQDENLSFPGGAGE